MFDDFGMGRRDDGFDPFSVMLFKALQVVSFLFFLALLAMAPKASEGKVDSKAEFIITMDWPDNHPDDLDLMVENPGGEIGCSVSRLAKWTLKRRKSISSQAESISAWYAVLLCPSIVAAFTCARHGPARSSAARTKIAARSSKRIAAQAGAAFSAAVMARPVTAAVA